MEIAGHHIAFGPIPSRRLGWSLGINNIPSKTCSYSCIYCQVGATTDKRIEPRRFFTPGQVRAAIESHVAKLHETGAAIDYLSFVPDGEPTLDLDLGSSIEALRPLGIPIAVFTNATLLWREEVRETLCLADLVSVKADTVDEKAWRRINRPHRGLRLEGILQGVRDFAAKFTGTLISETMLLAGVNDGSEALTDTAGFLAGIAPDTAFLAVPTRPPAVAGVQGTDAAGLTRAHEIYAARLPSVELLAGHETAPFSHTGDARADVLAITAVHPLREVALRRLLADDDAGWGVVEQLLADRQLMFVDYQGQRFYLRPLH